MWLLRSILLCSMFLFFFRWCVILWYYCGVHWNVKISMSNIFTYCTLRNEHFLKMKMFDHAYVHRESCCSMHIARWSGFCYLFGIFKWKRRFDCIFRTFVRNSELVWSVRHKWSTMKRECTEPKNKNSLIYTIFSVKHKTIESEKPEKI